MSKHNIKEMVDEVSNKKTIYKVFNTQRLESLYSKGLKFQYVKWHGKTSHSAIMITDEKEDFSKETVINVLRKLEIPESKIDQAINGEGNEYKRITWLNSSALLSLFCFSNICEKTPFVFENTKYTQVYFEWENRAVDKSHPSSLDVVLFDKTNEKMLCIESKFSEYVYGKTKKSEEFPTEYSGLYTQKENNFFSLRSGRKAQFISKESHYLSGIKQVLAHIYGIEHFAYEPRQNDLVIRPERKTLLAILKEVKFREFVFEYDSFDDFNSLYQALYQGLINKEYRVLESKNNICINIGSTINTYQKEFSAPENQKMLNENAKLIYSL